MTNAFESSLGVHGGFLAGADLSSAQFELVQPGSAALEVLAAGLGTEVLGALRNAPASGDAANIPRLGDIFIVKAGAAVAAWARVMSDASAKAVTATPGAVSFGYALKSASAADQWIPVLYHPGLALSGPAMDGHSAGGHFRATYDVSGGDSGAIGTFDMGVDLPDNAVITRAYYFVETTFTSATDAATIALGVNTDDVGGIVAAVAISDAGNPWDAGWAEGIQDGTAANFSEAATASRSLDAVVAVEALTAGKLILFGDYVIVD